MHTRAGNKKAAGTPRAESSTFAKPRRGFRINGDLSSSSPRRAQGIARVIQRRSDTSFLTGPKSGSRPAGRHLGEVKIFYNASAVGRKSVAGSHLHVQRKVIDKSERRLQGGYSDLVRTSEWQKEAVEFETRLGTFAAKDGRANGATKKGLGKMSNIFKTVYNTDTDDTAYLRPFGIDDTNEEKTSAGQVGTGTGTDIDAIREVVEEKKKNIFGLHWLLGDRNVTDVNLRERMTAFYNGAYFGKGFGGYSSLKPSLKKILHEIVLDQGDEASTKTGIDDKMQLAQSLGLDVAELRKLKGTMGSKYRRAMNNMMDIAENLGIAKNNFLFAEDVIGVGNLAVETVSKFWQNLEMPKSHMTKKARDDSGKLAHAKTPEDYEKMGVPLSSRERAFVNKNRAKEGLNQIQQAEKLPWREGIAYYYVDPDASWTQDMANRGFPVVAALSGTTARMISVFKWLNLGDNELLNFRLALMGWMLPSRDHSLYEILRGAEMVGVKGPDEDTSDAVAMYLHIAPLSESELRGSVCKDRMFPHESTYVALTQKKVGADADLSSRESLLLPGAGAVTAAKKKKKEYGHGGTVKQSQLNLSHTIALQAYTGPDHHILNAIMQWFESSYGVDNFISVSSEAKIADHLYTSVAKHLAGQGAEFPAVIRTELLAKHNDWKPIKDTFANGASTELEKQNALKALKTRCTELATKLKSEASVHINMLDEALNLLPPYSGKVYMGTWEAWGWHTGNSRATKKFNYYQSTTKNRGIAKGFADTHKNSMVKVPVLYEISLKNDGHGRDIEDFSKYRNEKEVLLMPPTNINVKPKKGVESGVSVHEADEA